MGEICSLKMKSYKAENQYCCIIVNEGEINLIKISVFSVPTQKSKLQGMF